MALSDHLRQRFTSLLKAPKLEHSLLLWGPPATGKTSAAELIAEHFFPGGRADRVLHINAALTRGIDVIREELLPLMRAAQGALVRRVDKDYWSLVIASEADGLTEDAQRALNDAMENFAATHKFIFTTNTLDGLIPSIRSRCLVIKLAAPPVEERTRVLAGILEKEGLEVEPLAVRRFAYHYEDMRQLFRDAQESIAIHGELLTLRVEDEQDLDLWPEPVDGATLLNELVAAFTRYVSLPEGATTSLALWTIFAHAHDAFEISPIIAVTSPVKRAGKTTLLHLLSCILPNPLFTSNITAAALFRGVEQMSPTLIADEADSWFNLRDEMRGVVNSGHTRAAAYVVRCAGAGVDRFSTWCPKIIALIRTSPRDLPPTIEDRSIVVPMRRRRSDEPLVSLRLDRIETELAPLRQKVARWAFDHAENLRAADPPVPGELHDRAADNWRPLLAIADVVGGAWPDLARRAAKLLSGSGDETDERNILALSDVRRVFRAKGGDLLPSEVLVGEMDSVDASPWRGWITPIRLAEMLRPFGVKPKALWGKYGDHRMRTIRGYFLKDLEDAFERYLPVRDAE